MRFDRAYSVASWTAPGLASILSGLYPPVHAINNRDHMGSPDMLTLLKIFKEHGYDVPNLNFFTFAPYYAHFGLPPIQREYFGQNPGDELINWIQKRTGSPEEKPFFVWYHCTTVHQPYNPAPEDRPAPLEELQKSPGIKAVMTGAIVPAGSTKFTDADRPVLDALYAAELKRVDRLFGKVLQLLSEKGLKEHTMIIFSADHGEELLDHGFVGHASTSLKAKLYEELVHIPLVISWPGKVPVKQVKQPVNQLDIMPTVLKLSGLEVPAFLHGRNLLGEIGSRPLFFESVIGGNQTTSDQEDDFIRGVLDQDYKYISDGELYNLAKDPKEQQNLADKEPKKVKRLKAELEKWLAQSKERAGEILPNHPEVLLARAGTVPRIFTPEDGKTLKYGTHTGMLLFDWAGDKKTTYLLEYDIGTGAHHVAGTYEVQGNHQLFGPLTRELWENLKAWNPFKVRVAVKAEQPQWSDWVTFRF